MNAAANTARKLLLLAENQEGTPEGSVAKKLADKILTKNGWTVDDVSRRDHLLLDPSIPDHEEWRRSLLTLVAENADVVVFETEEGAGVHGVEVDIAPAILLFETLARRIRVAASEFAEETGMLLPDIVPTETWYAGFAHWAVMGLLDRLIAEVEEPEPDEIEHKQIEDKEEDRAVSIEDDDTIVPPEWATMDHAAQAIEKMLDGDERVLTYCQEGYVFGQEVPLVLGIGSAPEYDMPLLLEERCEAS